MFIISLIGSLIFLVQLNELNQFDGDSLSIKIPFLVDIPDYQDGFKIWMVLVMTITLGVIIGFLLALFQILSQKSDIYSLKTKLRRLQIEIDNLRNESISEDIEIADESDDNLI